jgi:putative addiction module antidote
MSIQVKLTSIGNSVGVVLPKELLTRLRLQKGDVLTVIETPNGVELRASDPEFDRQMEVARRIMRERRAVLRELAK